MAEKKEEVVYRFNKKKIYSKENKPTHTDKFEKSEQGFSVVLHRNQLEYLTQKTSTQQYSTTKIIQGN